MNPQYENPIRKILNQPKLIIFGFYCVITVLVGIFGLMVMIGWIRNDMSLVRVSDSLPVVPFEVGFSFFFTSLALLYSLARTYQISKVIALCILIFNSYIFFYSLFQLDYATDFPIFRSLSERVVPVKISLAFILLCASIAIFASNSKKLGHLWIIAIFSSIVFGMSISAIFWHLTRIDGQDIFFNKIDIHLALKFFVLSSVTLYLTYLKYRSTYPNFCMRWLSILAFISLLWSTLLFYGALKNQEMFFKKVSLDQEALQMLKFTMHQSNVDKKSLIRIAARWNAIQEQAMEELRLKVWQKDSQLLVNDIKPLIGLVILKPDKTLLAEINQKDSSKDHLIRSREFLNLKEESWHPIKANDGRNILFAYFLLDFPDDQKGFLIAFYDLEGMIKTYPKFLQSEVCVNIFFEDKSLYFSDEKALLNDTSKEFIFSAQKKNEWKVKMWTLAHDLKSSTHFPDIFLSLGILMSALTGSMFYLYQKFKRQSFLLSNANAAKSLFLANVSHEIRTPLHAIMGTASLLEFTDLNSRQEHLLHILKVSSNHLLDLINNLLDITKIESGNMALKYIPTNIRELALDVIILFSEKAEEKGLNFRFDFHFPDEKKIMIPAREIKQILTNLISNAIKFTEAGIVTLEINVIQNDFRKGKLNINVSDTGMGIPDDKKQLIFEKFSQVVKDDTIKHSGTGLGLFISKLLVDKMKGQIRFESIDGQGTTFFVSIPVNFVTSEDIDWHGP